ncbi:flavin reductase family protein [Clostridium sp.]|uniref:flavin reductase family protein n=1 Tax=Clostridium sp. TaxID=1506 RepID=UPI00262A1B19|nr:flavin reductase family protein [Clostridium sp.]
MGKSKLKKSLGIGNACFPAPIAMVVVGSEEDYNVVTVALVGLVNCNPPMLSFTLAKSRHSCNYLKTNKQVTINFTSTANMKQVDFCGLVSGKDVNKFEKAELTPKFLKKGSVPIIDECCFHYIGEVVKEIEFESMNMYIVKIDDILVDENKINRNGNIDMKEMELLIYCTAIREYWSFGEKIGNGYEEGKFLNND